VGRGTQHLLEQIPPDGPVQIGTFAVSSAEDRHEARPQKGVHDMRLSSQ
jgi:hypothetical protein